MSQAGRTTIPFQVAKSQNARQRQESGTPMPIKRTNRFASRLRFFFLGGRRRRRIAEARGKRGTWGCLAGDRGEVNVLQALVLVRVRPAAGALSPCAASSLNPPSRRPRVRRPRQARRPDRDLPRSEWFGRRLVAKRLRPLRPLSDASRRRQTARLGIVTRVHAAARQAPTINSTCGRGSDPSLGASGWDKWRRHTARMNDDQRRRRRRKDLAHGILA